MGRICSGHLKGDHIKKLFILAILIFFIQFIFYDLFYAINRNAIFPLNRNITGVEKIKVGNTFSQKFNTYTAFQKISLLIDNKDFDGHLQVTLKNSENDQILFSRSLGTSKLTTDKGSGKLQLDILCTDGDGNRQSIDKGTYELKIKNKKANGDLALCMIHANDQVPAMTENGALRMSVTVKTSIGDYLAVFILLILVIYFLSVYYLNIKQKLTIEKFFILSFIPLSLIYLIIFLPWSTPDAGTHFYAIYRLTNLVSGMNPSNIWVGRAEDISFLNDIFEIGGPNPTISGYQAMYASLSQICHNGSMVSLPMQKTSMNFYSIFNYIPFIAGLLTGRILHLNIAVSLFLGRIFACALYGTLACRAIRITPTGKSVLALIMLLPMSLMNVSALSYDGIVMIATISFTASILRASYDRQNTHALYESIFWIFIIGASKGGGYLILLPLAFLFLQKPCTKNDVLKLTEVMAAGIISVLLWDVIVQGHGEALYQFGKEGGKNLTASMAFKDPLRYLNMLVYDYLREPDFLLGSMLGDRLAWLEPVIPDTLALFLVIVIGKASLLEKDLMKIDKKESLIFRVVLCMGIFLTPIMLLSWTPADSKYIDGLQGRYFLPLLPIAYMLITKFELRRKNMALISNDNREDEESIRKSLCVYAFLSCLVVYYMLRLYLKR